MTTPTTPAAARVAFERDAEPMGFDLRRHECMVPEPWSEYHDINTGHRWGGYLAATHAAAARESALIAERDALRAEVAELMRAALQAARQPQAQQGVAAPLELKVCHSQNASQTPQTDLSLMAAPQEWSPAYTRGPARQSAPVAAVPAMVPLTEEQMVSAVRPLCNTDQVAERLVAVSIDEYRAIEAASAKLNGLTVGDGAQPIKDTP